MPKHGAATPPPPPPPTKGGKEIAGDAKFINDTVSAGSSTNPGERDPNSSSIGDRGFKANVSVGGEMDQMIKTNLMDRVSGKNPKFSGEILGHMKEKLFRQTQGQTRRARMALMADAARRGVFRSEATGSLVADIEIAGIQAYSSGVKDLLIQKAMSDHDDMIKAIDSSQQWLANSRQYQLGLEQNEISRQGIKATLAAAAMSAAASRYAADQGLKGARAGASASRWAAKAAWADNRAVDANGEFLLNADDSPQSIQQAEFAKTTIGSTNLP